MERTRSVAASAARSHGDRLSKRASLAVIGGSSLVFWAAIAGLIAYLSSG